MDRNWKSVSKIALDLPWQPARAGRQEEREGKGGGEGAEGRGRGRWKVSSESEEGGTYHNGKPGQRIV